MKRKSIRALGISLAAVTLVTSVGTMSMANTQTNGSDGPLHIWKGSALVAPATTILWDGGTYKASPSTSSSTAIVCPVGSDGFRTFISPRGQERTLASHTGYNYQGGAPSAATNINPASMILGSAGGAQTAGGNYSLGIACTSNGGTTLVSGGAFYRHITVTAGTGDFVAAATEAVAVTPTPTPTPSETATSTTANRDGSVPLTATTIASADGTLSLSVPQGASVTFGTATLVNNKSTSTGTLPQVTVTDERYTSKLGWSVQANLTDFVSGGNTIGKANLAIVPSIVTNAGGVTVASTPLAGFAIAYPYTIADAALNNGVGTSVIGGGLTFTAPIATPAGTYTSTLTLTLVSK